MNYSDMKKEDLRKACKAAETGAIMLSEFAWQNGEYKLLNVFASLVGQNDIKANTWYKLIDGKPVECD